jgi:hypothetical protein
LLANQIEWDDTSKGYNMLKDEDIAERICFIDKLK